MNAQHFYGIAILAGIAAGFFVIARQTNTTVDAIYNSGFNTSISVFQGNVT